jgi:predicted DNA-binding transcriptional regulator AlpA
MKEIDKLPHWPRGLSRTLAASCVGVSPTTFDRMIKDGLMPRPKAVYGRRVWDKLAVDEAFDILDGGPPRDPTGRLVYEFEA